MNILNNKNKRKSIFKALALCLFAAVSLTFVSCDDDMDIQQSYPFTVETMPVPNKVTKGQTVEIRCELKKTGDYANTLYTIRYFQFEGEGTLKMDNGKSLMLALSQDLSQNRPAEAREHVRRFHEMFFTLSPEKSAIEHNVKRALLLADKSVYHYYSDFAEKGYYNRIIAGNINQVLKVDSVVCDFNAYPYRAVTYATQKIIRQSNVTERSLVTTCRLLNASRSDDNPNGFTIEGFTIIENKDLQTIKR